MKPKTSTEKQPYNKFFAMTMTASLMVSGAHYFDAPGIIGGAALAAGIIFLDIKYLNNRISTTTFQDVFSKKKNSP